MFFFDTAYFDNALQEKERYSCDSIELVSEEKGTIIGLIDVKLDAGPRSGDDVCSAMIWHVAVQVYYIEARVLTEVDSLFFLAIFQSYFSLVFVLPYFKPYLPHTLVGSYHTATLV